MMSPYPHICSRRWGHQQMPPVWGAGGGGFALISPSSPHWHGASFRTVHTLWKQDLGHIFNSTFLKGLVF